MKHSKTKLEMKRTLISNQNQNLLRNSIWIIAIIISGCMHKSKSQKMEGIEQQIFKICEEGIKSNCIVEGDSISKIFLSNIKEFEDENGVKNWIILKEMGGFCNWETKERNAKNVSTIIYEDYFFYFKISTIFSEISRITNKQFTFEIIDEFGSTYNNINESINQSFWKRLDIENGDANYKCKYKIMGEEVSLTYHFFKPNWTTLNPEFVTELLMKLEEIFDKHQISYLPPEEFLTLLVVNNDSKMKLKKDLNIELN
jgi:hypothetical protein